MQKFLKLGALVFARPFVNANAGSKVFISTTVVDPSTPLDDTAFEALTYTEIKGVGSHGEAGSSTNILTYDTWDTDVIQKAKGMTDGGSPEIELGRIPNDPGQIALRAAAQTNFNYAFKMERNDPETPVTGDPTIIYNAGIVTGPRRPFGRNEDFDLEIFTLGFNQREVVIDPT